MSGRGGGRISATSPSQPVKRKKKYGSKMDELLSKKTRLDQEIEAVLNGPSEPSGYMGNDVIDNSTSENGEGDATVIGETGSLPSSAGRGNYYSSRMKEVEEKRKWLASEMEGVLGPPSPVSKGRGRGRGRNPFYQKGSNFKRNDYDYYEHGLHSVGRGSYAGKMAAIRNKEKRLDSEIDSIIDNARELREEKEKEEGDADNNNSRRNRYENKMRELANKKSKLDVELEAIIPNSTLATDFGYDVLGYHPDGDLPPTTSTVVQDSDVSDLVKAFEFELMTLIQNPGIVTPTRTLEETFQVGIHELKSVFDCCGSSMNNHKFAQELTHVISSVITKYRGLLYDENGESARSKGKGKKR
eukprot:Pgem_evm1s3907